MNRFSLKDDKEATIEPPTQVASSPSCKGESFKMIEDGKSDLNSFVNLEMIPGIFEEPPVNTTLLNYCKS